MPDHLDVIEQGLRTALSGLEAAEARIAELEGALRRLLSDFEQRVHVLGRATDVAEVEAIAAARKALESNKKMVGDTGIEPVTTRV